VAQSNRLAAAMRERDEPVGWVRMVWDEPADAGLLPARSPFLAEALRRGTWGVEPVAGLDVRPEDQVVEKRRFSAFFDTELELLLADAGVTTVVVAGVRTDFCVESTVRDAMFRDLEAIVPREAVAGYFPDLHENSLRLMGTVFAWVAGVDETLALLGSAARPTTQQEV
jgi:nicotinamidase-related amidase